MRRLKWILSAGAILALASVYAWHLIFGIPYRQFFGEIHYRAEIPDKVVALTFDDGPDPLYTPRIVEILDRNQVKATFFMLGRKIAEHPGIAGEVHRAGHELGNHSFSHERMALKTPSFVRAEIDRTDLLLRDLGVTEDIHFRPPFGSQLYSVPLVLRERGKKNIFFDVDPRDWEMQDPSELTRRILGKIRPGSIILLHDSGGERSGTVQAVEMVVAELLARGFRFVTVSELLALAEGSGSGKN